MNKFILPIQKHYNDTNISAIRFLNTENRHHQWYSSINHVLTPVEIYRHVTRNTKHTYFLDRVKSTTELEEYLINTYTRLMSVKYDIKIYSKNPNDDIAFLDLFQRYTNNKRHNQIGESIVGYSWSIDVDKNDYLHMHWFLHSTCPWYTGHYETDRLYYKDHLNKLNRFILKLIRTDKNDLIKFSHVNLVDEEWDMIDYMSSIYDIHSRNRNRVWTSYNGHMEADLRAFDRGRWYSRSQIPRAA